MEGNTVAKIVMYYFDCGSFTGFEFLDKHDNCLLSAISSRGNRPPKQIVLELGERVLGVKSRLAFPSGGQYHETDGARHYDLQFIIGRLD